jgi:RNA polymerase sigma-70 factor, ECF subfamily
MLINNQKNFMDKHAVADDLELVSQAQSGDLEAVGHLFDKYYRSMFRYFYARVGQRQQAEDLAGELFTRMVHHLPSFQLSGVPFRAWLFRIAYNLTMDHFRVGNGKELASLDQATMLAQPEQNPVQQVEQQMTRDMLQTTLETLVPEQRQVIILRFLVGLSLQETADVLERSLSAVKAMQHRGLKTMRMSLAQVEL